MSMLVQKQFRYTDQDGSVIVSFAGPKVEERTDRSREQTGFVLDSLRGDFDLRDSLIVANGVYFKTPGSCISGNVLVYPKNLQAGLSLIITSLQKKNWHSLHRL